MTTTRDDIRPFRIAVPQESLDDLRERLNRVRWTSEIPGPGDPADYGVSLDVVQELTEYWRTGYDWRVHEAALNQYPQFITEIDGQDIHFLHIKSRQDNAIPLILTHGWPGSIFEFTDLIGPLTDPGSHGRDPGTAFDLVIPSLPGFAFSSPLAGRGWGTQRTAVAWAELMHRLGYERYGAAGKLQWFMDNKISFNQLQSQQPQTLAHALADSPVALLGWNLQLMTADAMGEKPLDDDFVLSNAALYWFTNTGGSAIRFYYEGAHAQQQAKEPTTVPLGVAGFAGDFSGVRRFAERDHQNLVQWNAHAEPGGHYAAHLEPVVMANDIRAFYAALR